MINVQLRLVERGFEFSFAYVRRIDGLVEQQQRILIDRHNRTNSQLARNIQLLVDLLLSDFVHQHIDPRLIAVSCSDVGPVVLRSTEAQSSQDDLTLRCCETPLLFDSRQDFASSCEPTTIFVEIVSTGFFIEF
jgi:hypothetical protein